MQVDYLETRLTSDTKADKETEHQLTKASRTAGCMNSLIWENKSLIWEAKISVRETAIRQ